MVKQKSQKSSKIISLQFSPKMTFLVHEFAQDSYELFCNIYPDLNLNISTKPDGKIIKLIQLNDIYYFCSDYEYLINLKHGDTIYIKLVDYSEYEIRQLGWNTVFGYIRNIHPVKPNVIRKFIKTLPRDIVIEGFENVRGKLSIADVLRNLNISRYSFDYQDKKTLVSSVRHQPMPKFDDLIAEVINEQRP